MPIVKVKPGQKIRLKDIDPNNTGQFKSKDEARAQLTQNIEQIAELQNILYAENKHALLIVLQAMDAGGKDGITGTFDQTHVVLVPSVGLVIRSSVEIDRGRR